MINCDIGNLRNLTHVMLETLCVYSSINKKYSLLGCASVLYANTLTDINKRSFFINKLYSSAVCATLIMITLHGSRYCRPHIFMRHIAPPPPPPVFCNIGYNKCLRRHVSRSRVALAPFSPTKHIHFYLLLSEK